jgi:hypothetical protein
MDVGKSQDLRICAESDLRREEGLKSCCWNGLVDTDLSNFSYLPCLKAVGRLGGSKRSMAQFRVAAITCHRLDLLQIRTLQTSTFNVQRSTSTHLVIEHQPIIAFCIEFSLTVLPNYFTLFRSNSFSPHAWIHSPTLRGLPRDTAVHHPPTEPTTRRIWAVKRPRNGNNILSIERFSLYILPWQR